MTAAERGTTKIAERVVARIMTRAADETAESGGLGRTILGVPVGRHRSVRADAKVDGGIVTARMAISVEYPTPVREVAQHVRESVRDRVKELTGLTVRQVDIEVAALERPKAGAPRRTVS